MRGPKTIARLMAATESIRAAKRGASNENRVSIPTATGADTPIGEGIGTLVCHEDEIVAILEIGGLRILHAACAPSPTSCGTCHNVVPHGPAVRWIREPVMDDCVGCHNEAGVTTECDICHEGRLTTERLSTGPWAVTHGPAWRSMHGLGDLRTCVTCHDEEKCRGCHEIELPHPRGFPLTHGADAIAHEDACLTCHDIASLCDPCHGLQMPHPDSFLPEHSGIASGLDDPVCATCHIREDCTDCHVAHTHPGRTDGSLHESALPAPGGGP
jgi:hypothetical protein